MMKSRKGGGQTPASALLPSAKGLKVCSLSLAISALSATAFAQDAVEEEVIVSGIRASLANALEEKRSADNLVEVIQAEDIGKLPDQNLAEVLENVTGIQITRTAGVGTGVQIRGTNANRVEINGVSTVGSGSGRSGIDFEDVNASIISAVEITKSPEAKTIEGSVGGTVNLRTVRPLELKEVLGSIRVQGEDSSLSTEGIKPRFSGAFGNNWDTDIGEIGFVISGSYTEQEAVSFRPRADRDGGLVENIDADVVRDGVVQDVADRPAAQDFDFLGVQFLLQEQENDDYETTNIATSFEWAPNENLTIFTDYIVNEQERSRDQYRVQASGVSTLRDVSEPDDFETVDLGSLGGYDLGSIAVATRGTLEPDLSVDDDDPNLRFSSETGSRVTDSEIIRIGGTWENDDLKATIEFARTESSTRNPTLNTTLNFINPNCPLDGSSNDNCVPFEYDLSGGSLAFGINFDSPFAPDVEDLTNPENVVLDQVDIGRNETDNKEEAFRVDFEYNIDLGGITSLDFGYRRNFSSSKFNDIDGRIGGFSQMEDSPNGLLFEELLVEGPDNYADADGRDLAVRNFLLIDPDRSFSDPEGVISILEDALAAHRELNPTADGDLSTEVEADENAFYDVEEETDALYLQANFEYADIVRGNIGVRYVTTDVSSTSFGPDVDLDGQRDLQTLDGSYDYVLPRLNLVVQPLDDVIFRLGYGKDIRRPDFDELNTAFSFSNNENATLALGNPGLEPEEVDSFDITAEWYFAPSAVVSLGYFQKDRTNIFGTTLNSAGRIFSEERNREEAEADPACSLGGIWNPIVQPNQLGDPDSEGLCVDFTIPENDPATTTVSGIEFAVQYDLAEFEDVIGFASGFGALFNYTLQEFEGGSTTDTVASRGIDVLNATAFGEYDDANWIEIEEEQGLLDFSENAYNFTLFYEKYGLSARARYTWREAFRTEDFAGGASTNSTMGFPVVTSDRGQLNASINYDVTENLNIGVEGVNLTESGITQYCLNDGAILCFEGIPDRRVTFGATYTF